MCVGIGTMYLSLVYVKTPSLCEGPDANVMPRLRILLTIILGKFESQKNGENQCAP